jgi:hypothetical protein
VQAGLPKDPAERLRLGLQAAAAAVNRFAGKRVGAAVLTPLLSGIRLRYGFTSLVVSPERDRWAVAGEINPRSRHVTNALIQDVRAASEADDDFDPEHFTDAQMRRLYDSARRLGLGGRTIRDLLFIAGRREKPITEEGLIRQMNNWVRVVNPRGFPYRFKNLPRFNQFTETLLTGLAEISLPTHDVRVQGSALRNPDARDIDVAVMLSNSDFDDLLVRCFQTTARRNNTEFLTPNTKLREVAVDIDQRPAEYNAIAKTFAFAMTNRKIRPQDVDGLDRLRVTLQRTYGPLDISVMTAGGTRELRPFLKLSR